MDRAYIDSHNLIDEYVRGKLSGNELEEFEIYMLEHPEVVDDIEFAKGMQDALDKSKDSLFTDSANSAAAGEARGFWLSRQYAVAATVLLATTLALSGYLFDQTRVIQAELDTLRVPRPLSGELWLETVRGENAIRTVVHKPGEAFVLHIVPDIPITGEVVVTISAETADWHWTTKLSVSDVNETLDIVIAEISPGSYQVELASKDGEKLGGILGFRVKEDVE